MVNVNTEFLKEVYALTFIKYFTTIASKLFRIEFRRRFIIDMLLDEVGLLAGIWR